MGWDKIADLASGIFNRWFSKESKEEARDNEIGKLEKEQLRLSKDNLGGKYDGRLDFIAKRLSKLNEEARNAR